MRNKIVTKFVRNWKYKYHFSLHWSHIERVSLFCVTSNLQLRESSKAKKIKEKKRKIYLYPLGLSVYPLLMANDDQKDYCIWYAYLRFNIFLTWSLRSITQMVILVACLIMFHFCMRFCLNKCCGRVFFVRGCRNLMCSHFILGPNKSVQLGFSIGSHHRR